MAIDDAVKAATAVTDTSNPEKNAEDEVLEVVTLPGGAKGEGAGQELPPAKPHYSYTDEHRQVLMAQGYTAQELQAALDAANAAWAAAPADKKPIGALSSALMALAEKKGKPVGVQPAVQTKPAPTPAAAPAENPVGKPAENPAASGPQTAAAATASAAGGTAKPAAKPAAKAAKPAKAAKAAAKAKPGSLDGLTAAERRERRLQQKREANKRWREKHGGSAKAAKKPAVKKAAPKKAAPPKKAAAKKHATTVVKGAKGGTVVLVHYDDLNATEKAVLQAITGVTPEVAEARDVGAIAQQAFPDLPGGKAKYTTQNGLRRLTRGGLVERVGHGMYRPGPKAFNEAGRGVLEEAIAEKEAAEKNGSAIH